MNRFCLIILLVNFITIPLSFAGEKSVYSFSWLDPDKEVYVLQNRKFRKKGRFHLNAGFGMTTSGAFIDANTLQGRFGFFPYEEWGLEFIFAKNSGTENATATSVRNTGSNGSIPFRRITQDYLGGMLLWSPFYMKINTFNTIIYVDWIVGVGYGKITEKNNRKEVIDSSTYNEADVLSETHNGLMWGTAFKFYISETFSIRADLTAVSYSAPTVDVNSSVSTSNFDFSLAVGLNF